MEEGRRVIMGSETAEAHGDQRDSQSARVTRGYGKSRHRQENGTEGLERFFLSQPDPANSVPELGKEFATEPEAIVESLKTGLSYFTVSEWRGTADFSGKKPQLKRQGVIRTQNTS
jgi:hypothetical protein